MMDALDAGADDMQADDEVFEIYTDPDAFNDVVAALEAKGYTFLEADVQMVPQNYVKLTDEEDIKNMEKLIDVPGGQRRRAERLPQLGAGLIPPSLPSKSGTAFGRSRSCSVPVLPEPAGPSSPCGTRPRPSPPSSRGKHRAAGLTPRRSSPDDPTLQMPCWPSTHSMSRKNSSSLSTGTPSSWALRSLEPAASPATT